MVVLRGQHVNPWELRSWEQLEERFEVIVPVAGAGVHDLSGMAVQQRPARTLADLVPSSRGAALAAQLPQNRYRDVESLLRGADVVHAAELSFWFTAQAARLKASLGFRLVTTVWETIPFRSALRFRLARGNREAVLAHTDLFLACTRRAREGLLLEGVDPARVVIAEPGIDLERFGAARSLTPEAAPLVLSPGRLVWEKGHQDVLRAVAALRGGLIEGPRDVRALILGSGPEERALKAYAEDLGLRDAVEFRATVPYDEMPRLYGRASAMALMSLPVRRWEEQFGMVLVEGMAAGLPIVSTTSGAIPEVTAGAATLVPPGDWAGLARELGRSLATTGRVDRDPALLERYSVRAAATRLAAAYDRVLA